jgi:hypothetical protein
MPARLGNVQQRYVRPGGQSLYQLESLTRRKLPKWHICNANTYVFEAHGVYQNLCASAVTDTVTRGESEHTSMGLAFIICGAFHDWSRASKNGLTTIMHNISTEASIHLFLMATILDSRKPNDGETRHTCIGGRAARHDYHRCAFILSANSCASSLSSSSRDSYSSRCMSCTVGGDVWLRSLASSLVVDELSFGAGMI